MIHELFRNNLPTYVLTYLPKMLRSSKRDDLHWKREGIKIRFEVGK